MAIRIRYNCPHCHQDLTKSDSNYLYGSPFRICPNCREPYFDKRYHEAAVTGVRSMDRWRVPPMAIINFTMGVLFGALAVFALSQLLKGPTRGDDLWGMILSLLVGSGISAGNWVYGFKECSLEAYQKRLDYLSREEVASRARLSVPKYALALKLMKVPVPPQYLAGQQDPGNTPQS